MKITFYFIFLKIEKNPKQLRFLCAAVRCWHHKMAVTKSLTQC